LACGGVVQDIADLGSGQRDIQEIVKIASGTATATTACPAESIDSDPFTAVTEQPVTCIKRNSTCDRGVGAGA